LNKKQKLIIVGSRRGLRPPPMAKKVVWRGEARLLPLNKTIFCKTFFKVDDQTIFCKTFFKVDDHTWNLFDPPPKKNHTWNIFTPPPKQKF